MSGGVLLIGGGGHASVVLDSLRAMGRACRGVIAMTEADLPGAPYLGDDAQAFRQFPEGVEAALGLGGAPAKGSPGTARRRSVYEAYVTGGFHFPQVVGRGVVISPDVFIEDGVQVMAGAILQPNVHLGCNVLINTGACVDHDTIVDAHAMVGPGAVLCGGVRIGEAAYVGAGATVLQGIRIGAGAVVAAGAVATFDVAPGGFVARR